MNFIWGLLGIVFIFAVAFILSNNKKAIRLQTVLGGFALQLLFAFIVLKWSPGRKAVEVVTEKISNVMNYSRDGVQFLFGNLGDAAQSTGFIFAFQVLTIIIFLSSLISVLYYLGIMQIVIRFIGGGLAKLLGTKQAESLSAAANIFLGQTEAPLLIRPYISRLTNSQLFAVMVGGLASVSGSTLFGYAALGVPIEYLLAASLMSAPAGLAMAKLIFPETEKAMEKEDVTFQKDKEVANVVDAAARGASDGLQLALNVGAMLLAFIALISLLNGMLEGIGHWFNVDNMTLDRILGYVFAPVAFLIGVPWSEAVTAGSFIGQKLILNEFVAYSTFAPQMDMLSDKTVAIITFALCGFANISSFAILLGGLGGMAPERRNDIAKLGIRAIIAGTLANLLSATIAGMFF